MVPAYWRAAWPWAAGREGMSGRGGEMGGFIFGAFDPAGPITVDKLPGALWMQALSVRAFGVHPWAIVLPQVIEGVLTVLVLYRAAVDHHPLHPAIEAALLLRARQCGLTAPGDFTPRPAMTARRYAGSPARGRSREHHSAASRLAGRASTSRPGFASPNIGSRRSQHGVFLPMLGCSANRRFANRNRPETNK
jgi:Dolichyl-phosphate-mannose-protein mannosyltransferase